MDVSELAVRVTRLEERIDSFVTNELGHLSADIKEIKSVIRDLAMRNNRPSWTVIWLLTGMCSLCSGLIVTLFK